MTPEQLEVEAELLYLARPVAPDSSVCWCCWQSLFGSSRFSLVRSLEGGQQLAHKQCAVRFGENQRMPAGPRWADISQIAKTLWRGRVLTGELADLF